MRDGAATARRQMCIQWTLLVGKMSASRRRAIGYRFGKGFRLPFAVQSKGSLKTNECGIIMNAGENIGSLKCLPRASYGLLASRALAKDGGWGGVDWGREWVLRYLAWINVSGCLWVCSIRQPEMFL